MAGDASDLPVKFGKYELLERIGDGGMAEVFRARFVGVAGFSKTVVVKRMLPHLVRKPQYVDMFVAEATLAAQVQHKNVVQVFELSQLDSGEYFIVMELVEGLDFRQLLKIAARRKLRVPPWFTLRIVTELLAALDYAHGLRDEQGNLRNIVHRDVTPSNVFLSVRGEVKLGDFGVAHDTARPWQTQAGQLKGKVAYMAPEQLYTRAIDARTDLFAAGVVLWEGLAQRRLFGGGPDIEVMNRIVNGPRRAVTHYAKDVPVEFDQLLFKAVSVDPQQRFQSAREMKAAVQELGGQLGATPTDDAMRSVIEVMCGRAAAETAGVGSIDDAKKPTGSGSHPNARSRSASGFRSFSTTGTRSPIPDGLVEDPLYYKRVGDSTPVPAANRMAVNGGYGQVFDDPAGPAPTPPPVVEASDAEIQRGLSQAVTPPHTVKTPPGGTPRPSAWARGPQSAPPLPPKSAPLRSSTPSDSMRRLEAITSDLPPLNQAPSRLPPPRRPSAPIPLGPNALTPIPENAPVDDAMEALVAEAVSDVRNMPEAKLELVPHDTMIAGFDVRRHADRVSDHALRKWGSFGLDEMAYEGEHPFWLRDNDQAKIGPCAYDKAVQIARSELRARLSSTSEISPDGAHWTSLRDFALLVGMESMLRHDDELVPKSGLLVGTLGRRSLASVFGMLSRNQATGRLFVVERLSQSTDFREIEVVKGRPTYVYANEPRLQLPDLLVDKELVPSGFIGRLVHDALKQRKTLASLASAYLATDLGRYVPLFMKERLVEAFARSAGKFTFEERTDVKHKRPFAKSLNALLPELVHRSIDNQALKHALRSVMDAELRPCENFARRIDEMALTRAQLTVASYLANGKRVGALIRQWPEEKRLYLTMAYVLVETELLKPA